ncbi:unnamed protein product [Tetraodon nigroviridis]|uniref:(spotted green pufferfish) hypothetical protein n=1 Tax=Tetraodon nigroviridis TaxID=99883 RepID=Q4RC50_TETNG|nr:unnamed protein product [Tetraodon nigroviridis]
MAPGAPAAPGNLTITLLLHQIFSPQLKRGWATAPQPTASVRIMSCSEGAESFLIKR